jgi:hypothetical protein
MLKKVEFSIFNTILRLKCKMNLKPIFTDKYRTNQYYFQK